MKLEGWRMEDEIRGMEDGVGDTTKLSAILFILRALAEREGAVLRRMEGVDSFRNLDMMT